MDRRTFLKAVVAVPLAATCAVTASKAWPAGSVIMLDDHGRLVLANGSWRTARIVGVWDGVRLVTRGRTMVRVGD